MNKSICSDPSDRVQAVYKHPSCGNPLDAESSALGKLRYHGMIKPFVLQDKQSLYNVNNTHFACRKIGIKLARPGWVGARSNAPTQHQLKEKINNQATDIRTQNPVVMSQ